MTEPPCHSIPNQAAVLRKAPTAPATSDFEESPSASLGFVRRPSPSAADLRSGTGKTDSCLTPIFLRQTESNHRIIRWVITPDTMGSHAHEQRRIGNPLRILATIWKLVLIASRAIESRLAAKAEPLRRMAKLGPPQSVEPYSRRPLIYREKTVKITAPKIAARLV